MAKIKVFGQAAVITSTQKLEDLKTIAKYRPDALLLKDEDGDPLFRIGVSANNAGNIDKYGAKFGGKTHDDEELATITIGIPNGVEDVKEFVSETVGVWVLTLSKLEETLPAVLEEIAAEKAKIAESIEVL